MYVVHRGPANEVLSYVYNCERAFLACAFLPLGSSHPRQLRSAEPWGSCIQVNQALTQAAERSDTALDTDAIQPIVIELTLNQYPNLSWSLAPCSVLRPHAFHTKVFELRVCGRVPGGRQAIG